MCAIRRQPFLGPENFNPFPIWVSEKTSNRRNFTVILVVPLEETEPTNNACEFIVFQSPKRIGLLKLVISYAWVRSSIILNNPVPYRSSIITDVRFSPISLKLFSATKLGRARGKGSIIPLLISILSG